jgi:hypothetical protein
MSQVKRKSAEDNNLLLIDVNKLPSELLVLRESVELPMRADEWELMDMLESIFQVC